MVMRVNRARLRMRRWARISERVQLVGLRRRPEQVKYS